MQRCIFITLFLLGGLAATNIWAGPPFQTDDPEPIEFRHYEVYLFGAADATPVETDPVAPAFEAKAPGHRAACHYAEHAMVPA